MCMMERWSSVRGLIIALFLRLLFELVASRSACEWWVHAEAGTRWCHSCEHPRPASGLQSFSYTESFLVTEESLAFAG